MPKRTKPEAIKIIHDCAVVYAKNLAGKSLLFVTTKDSTATGIEATFLPRNYMHLTGVISRLKGDLFYQAALNNRLSVDDITLSGDGKTEQKLDILPHCVTKLICKT